MRFIKTLFTSPLLLMLGCVFLFAGTPKELTGEEWVQMVQDEKADFVKFAIQLYKNRGVAVNKPTGFYVYALDTTISSDTEYESESVYNLLDELLRRNEPGVQTALHSSKVSPEKT